MRRITKIRNASIGIVAVAGLTLGLTACGGGGGPKARQVESASRDATYDKLIQSQPAHSLSYSPTRNTKNFWIDTWGKDPNKLSYIYIQNAKGEFGYYILKGLPVTYCVSLIPPEQLINGDVGDQNGDFVVKAPSVDGTYSSNANCNSYYGIDATTNAYVEFSVGTNQSYFLYDQPLDLPQYKDAQPLGPTTVAAAKNIKK